MILESANDDRRSVLVVEDDDMLGEAIGLCVEEAGYEVAGVAQSVDVPVLKPNEAMFAEAIAIGGTVGMLATFEPSIASMGVEFKADAAQFSNGAAINVTLQTKFVPDAMAALLAGD